MIIFDVHNRVQFERYISQQIYEFIIKYCNYSINSLFIESNVK